ncbi:MAG: hypothetical protein AAB426_12135, partial [Myxococcota bacterium]
MTYLVSRWVLAPWLRCGARVLVGLGVAVAMVACDRPLLHDVRGRASPTDVGCGPAGVAASLEATVSDGAVLLVWVVTQADVDGFIVQRADGAGLSWGEVGRTAAGVLSYNDLTVLADTAYSYRVRTYRLQGATPCEGADSEVLDVLSRPAAPTGLFRTFPTTDSVLLTWADASTHEDGYRVERSDGGAYAVIATLVAGAADYLDDGLVESATYVYRVYAFNVSGDSLPAELSVRMPGPPMLSWGAAPGVDDACWLNVPGVADFADGVAVQSASGTVAKASGAVTADETGISAALTDLTPGTFATSWTVTDVLDGSGTITRDLALDVQTVQRTASRLPALAADEDAMIGRQADLAGCKSCVGRRGSIAAGVSHSCVVTDTGGVLCWGDGTYGALGNGYSDALANPTAACGGPAVALCSVALSASAVVTGADHVCAIGAAGALYCWGSNSDGQVGDGTTTERSTPVPVCVTGSTDTGDCVQLNGVASVSLGARHTCALVGSGDVHCWGDNSSGKLGDGTIVDRVNPTMVCATGSTDASCVGLASGFPGVVQISVGDEHSCAVTAGHDIKCWGSNYWSQLGLGHLDGDSDDHPNPVSVCTAGSSWSDVLGSCDNGGAVLPLAAVASVSSGALHTCVVLTGGELRCWGDDRSGQLGDASSAAWDWRDNPVPVCLTGSGTGGNCAALTGASVVVSGAYHACA